MMRKYIPLILIAALLFVPSVAASTITTDEVPPGSITLDIDEEYDLTFKTVLEGFNSSMLVLQLDGPQSISVHDYSFRIDGHDLRGDMETTYEGSLVTFNIDPVNPPNGLLTIKLKVVPEDSGELELWWRFLVIGFNEPPNPPQLVNVEGDVTVTVEEPPVQPPPPPPPSPPSSPSPPPPSSPPNEYRVTVTGIEPGFEVEYLLDDVSAGYVACGEEMEFEGDYKGVLSVPSVVDYSDGVRYVCVDNQLEVTPMTEEYLFTYVKQFHLNVSTGYGLVETEPSSVDGYYPVNQTVSISLIHENPPNMTWNGWSGNGDASYEGMAKNITITLTEPVEQNAQWSVIEPVNETVDEEPEEPPIIEPEENETDSEDPQPAPVELMPLNSTFEVDVNEVLTGGTVTIHVDAVNPNADTVQDEVVVYIDDVPEFRTRVSLRANQSTEQTYTKTFDEPGYYKIRVGDHVEKVTVIEESSNMFTVVPKKILYTVIVTATSIILYFSKGFWLVKPL